MIPIPVISQPPFTPRQLFAALQGAWLEPKQGLIWQENTGVTPATTGGQTIGLMLDQSQGAVLGPELVTNGTFDAGTSGWASGASGTIEVVSGVMRVNNVTGGYNRALQVIFTVSSGFYKISVTSGGTSALLSITSGSGGGALNIAAPAYFLHTGGNITLQAYCNSPSTGIFASFDNISVRQILGNHAYQATAANRPVLGRRYNLLAYSEDFGNAYWQLQKASIVNGSFAAPFGSTFAQKLVEDSTSGEHYLAKPYLPGMTVGATYTYSVYLKAGERTRVRVGQIYGLGTGGGAAVYVDLSAKSIISTSGGTAGLSVTIQDVGNSWVRLAIKDVAFSTEIDPIHVLVHTGTTANYTGDGTSGIYIWGAQLEQSPTATAYQRITTATDYDYGQYPAAVFDTNDFLSLSLPAINVRRNLLTYSEQFDNADWTKTNTTVTPNSVIAPNGLSTGARYVGAAGAGQNINVLWQGTVGISAAAKYTYSVYLRQGEFTSASFRFAAFTGTPPTGFISQTLCSIDLTNGVISAISSGTFTGVSCIATHANNGWYRLVVTATTPSGTVGVQGRISTAGTADGTSSFYVYGAQLELGSVATDYQKITDWTSEAYSSSGSVYFSTPVGMSQLNNQSMGTTYTLPALSSDIYSWMVFPQRLSGVQESRLQRYMLQKSGIAGPDTFEQVDYGPELFTTFGTVTAPWISLGGGAWSIDGTQSGNRDLSQSTQYSGGKFYVTRFTLSGVTGGTVNVYAGEGAIGPAYGNGTHTIQSLASQAYLIFRAPAGVTATVSNISVRELKDGVTGQLTDDAGDLIFTAQ